MAGEGQVTLAIVAKNLTTAELANVQSALKGLQLQTQQLNVSGLQPTTKTTGKFLEGLEHGQGSVRRLTSGLSFFAVEASGLNPHLARLTEGMLLFGGGHGAVLGAVAAVGVLALAVKFLNGDFTEHARQVKELETAYGKLVDAQGKLRTPTENVELANKLLAETNEKLAATQEEVARTGGVMVGDVVDQDAANKLVARSMAELNRLTLLREQALAVLEKPGLDEVDRLTEEAVGLQRSKDAMVIYRLELAKVPPEIIENIRINQAAIAATKATREEQDTHLQLLVRYGAGIGFTTQQVEAWRLALARAQAVHQGLSQVEVEARVREEEERIALEKLEAQQKRVTEARQKAIDQFNRDQAERAAGGGPMQTSAATGGLPDGDTGGEPPVFALMDRINAKLRDFREQAGDPLQQFQALVGDDAGAWQRLYDLIAKGLPAGKAVAQITREMQLMQETTDILQAGFDSLFSAIGEGSKFSLGVFLRAMARMAAAKASFEFAEGLAALAASIFPGVPTAGVSAANHFRAAAVFGLLAGGLSAAAGAAGGGGSSTGAGGGPPGTTTAPSKTATIVIQGGILNMTDPVQADAFAKAYKELQSRGVTDVTLVPG